MSAHSMTLHTLAPWLAAMVVAGLVGAIWYAIRNHRRGTDNLSRTERALPWEEVEVLALARQEGGMLLQTEFAARLPLDADQVAAALKALEARKLVHRRWNEEQKTFEVSPG
jgi:DNA-binding MarR family transcriptional regulator